MNNPCFTSLQLCRLRVSLLDDSTGAPDPGSTSVYVTDAPIDLGYKLNVKAGTVIQQESGCGTLCVNFRGDDSIESVDLTTTLCKLDSELAELMTGGSLVTVAGNTRGYALPQVGDLLTRRVSIEAWTLAYDFDEPASPYPYVRYVFPSTQWRLADASLSNASNNLPLAAKGRSNSGFGDGPANDLPWDAYTSPFGWFYDTDLPDAFCGYQALVAS